MAENADKEGGREVEGRAKEMKSTLSLSKKKAPSKALQSRLSLKKLTSMSQTSYASDSSLVNKRQSDFERITKAPRYQNTYRLDSKFPFKPDEVYKVLATVVDREASEYPHYDSISMAKLAQAISGEVRSAVRHLNYDRYKICVLVYVGENKLQGFHASFRSLWDAERDAWATYYYHCRTYFISCTCFGLYHD